jgi:Type VI secretion system/phage-baseplate injector OB domain
MRRGIVLIMREPRDHAPDLDQLLERVKAEAINWTNARSDDPGITLVELFAFLAESLAAYADRLADEAYLADHGSTSRPVIGGQDQPGEQVATAATFCGIYRARVVSDIDPSQQGRLLVLVPQVHGTQASWAAPCFPPVDLVTLPSAGDDIWVMFEGCDVDYPVWVGRMNEPPVI